MMKLSGKLIGVCVCCLMFAACSREPTVKDADIVTVVLNAASSTSYYTGIIAPMKTTVIPSPVDGAVIDLYFQYGDSVKRGQALFALSSSKFLSDYKTALLDYVKAKNDFNQNTTQLKESTFLHKNLLISDDEFASKKSAYYGSELAYTQAKEALSFYLTQMNIKNIDLYKLSITDIAKITEAMHLQQNADHITLVSPSDGVVLAPKASDSDLSKKINKGDPAKQGEPLALIGDMQGISVRFKVNELTINQVHEGQGVTITGIAFPSMVLTGNVTEVDKQADSSNGGLPSFTVQVSAPLTSDEKAMIHPGMSANIEMNLKEPMRLHVPIKAIIESGTETFVKIIAPNSHKVIEVAIATGRTSIDSVEVLSGLHQGDRVVVPH